MINPNRPLKSPGLSLYNAVSNETLLAAFTTELRPHKPDGGKNKGAGSSISNFGLPSSVAL